MRRWWIIGILFLSAICFSCSNKGNSQNNNDNGDDTNPPGSDLEVSSPVDVDTDISQASISFAPAPSGQWAVAYYKDSNSTILCYNHTPPAEPPPIGATSLYYAQFDGTSWTKEEVTPTNNRIMGPPSSGVSLVFSNSNPIIAYRGGDPSSQCCVASDLIQATRTGSNSWTINPIVTDSYQAPEGPAIDPGHPNCPVGQALCDTGDMVGHWPSQAVAPNGTVGVVYRDTHLCYAETDVSDADVEMYISGANPSHEWIDLGRGGGAYSRLVYDKDNVPAVTFYNGKWGTINFSRRESSHWPWKFCSKDTDCSSGQICQFTRCATAIAKNISGLPEGSLSLTVDSAGRYLLAYYDSASKKLAFSHSADGITWHSAKIDTGGIVGMYPNIMINPVTTKPVIVYYRCAASDYTGSDCDYNQDGVRLAVFVGSYPDELTTKSKWKRYNLDAELNKDATDGQFVSAAIQSDGTIGLAYLYYYYDQPSKKDVSKLVFRTIKILKSN